MVFSSCPHNKMPSTYAKKKPNTEILYKNKSHNDTFGFQNLLQEKSYQNMKFYGTMGVRNVEGPMSCRGPQRQIFFSILVLIYNKYFSFLEKQDR